MPQTDKKTQELIDRYGELGNQVEELKNELSILSKEILEMEDILRPLLEELEETGERVIEGRNFFVTISKIAHERKTLPYKELWELAYTKVNRQTQAIFKKLEEENKKVTQIKSKLSARKKPLLKGESKISKSSFLFSKIYDKIKGYFSKLTKSFSAINKSLYRSNKELEAILSKIKNEGIDVKVGKLVEGKNNTPPQDQVNFVLKKVGEISKGKKPLDFKDELMEEPYGLSYKEVNYAELIMKMGFDFFLKVEERIHKDAWNAFLTWVGFIGKRGGKRRVAEHFIGILNNCEKSFFIEVQLRKKIRKMIIEIINEK